MSWVIWSSFLQRVPSCEWQWLPCRLEPAGSGKSEWLPSQESKIPESELGLGCSWAGWWWLRWSIWWVYWSTETELLSPLTLTQSHETELMGSLLYPVINGRIYLRRSVPVREYKPFCLCAFLRNHITRANTKISADLNTYCSQMWSKPSKLHTPLFYSNLFFFTASLSGLKTACINYILRKFFF